jgi:hypothetical protein
MPAQYWRLPLALQTMTAGYLAVNMALAWLFFPTAFATALVALLAVTSLISWANPFVTACAVIYAVWLGVTGACFTLFSLWMLLAARRPLDHQSVG